jgi:hypothetical protein
MRNLFACGILLIIYCSVDSRIVHKVYLNVTYSFTEIVLSNYRIIYQPTYRRLPRTLRCSRDLRNYAST